MVRTVLAAALLIAITVASKVPAQSVFVGVYGGVQLQSTSWHLHKNELVDDTPTVAGVTGLRVGGMVHPLGAVEASIGVTPFASAADDVNIAMHYGADLQLHFIEGDWAPYLDLGAGLYHNISGDHGADVDYRVQYGLGVRGMLTDRLALRVDAKHIISDGFLDELAHNIELTVGLDFFAWVSP